MTILCPADPFETKWATKTSIKLKKPVYLRLGKRGEPILYKKPVQLKVGKGSILKVGSDIAILTTGNIVFNALEAAEILSKKNIKSTVVSMHTIKPLDLQLIQHLSKKFPIMVTVEEHSIIGGLGSSVSEIISENNYNTKLIRIGIPDRFLFEIGSQNYLREKIGLLSEQIAEKIFVLLKDNK
jgi:transketolase